MAVVRVVDGRRLVGIVRRIPAGGRWIGDGAISACLRVVMRMRIGHQLRALTAIAWLVISVVGH